MVFGNIKVVASPMIVPDEKFVQFRFPRSKKKRIRNKWKKKAKNYRFQEFERVLKMDDTIFVSQKVFEKFKQIGQGEPIPQETINQYTEAGLIGAKAGEAIRDVLLKIQGNEKG